MAVEEVPVAWIVVPVELVATTLIGSPCVEPLSNCFEYVAMIVLYEYIWLGIMFWSPSPVGLVLVLVEPLTTMCSSYCIAVAPDEA